MKALVFLEIGADVRVPPQRDPRSGRVREEWLVRELDPASARALDLAFGLKATHPGTEVTVIHLGPPAAEPWLRQALARGCDKAMRVWDVELAEAHAPGKAVVLAAAAQAAGFDLVLTGTAGVLASSGQVGVLLAEVLGVAAVTQVVDVTIGDHGDAAADAGVAAVAGFTRGLDGGFRERVEARLPVVATVAAGLGASEGAAGITATAMLAARGADIPVWDLANLGVPRDLVRHADEAMRYGRPRPVRPRLHPITAPDSSLPAFDRILKLVEGSVRRREGRLVTKPAEEIVEEVFRTLKDEGWLDHLRSPERP